MSKKFENRKTIKEWELETGIEIKSPKGFRGSKSKLWNKLYNKKVFKDCAIRSEIRCKTEKGLDFLFGGAKNGNA